MLKLKASAFALLILAGAATAFELSPQSVKMLRSAAFGYSVDGSICIVVVNTGYVHFAANWMQQAKTVSHGKPAALIITLDLAAADWLSRAGIGPVIHVESSVAVKNAADFNSVQFKSAYSPSSALRAAIRSLFVNSSLP